MSAYTEDFNKLSLRARRQEEEVERVARYINGLRQWIQDEIIMMAPDTMDTCFSLALRVEEKARRRHDSQQRGRGNRGFRGRGNLGRGQGPNRLEETQAIDNGDN